MQKESSLLGCLNQIKMSRRKAAPLYSAQKHCGMTNGAESNSPAPRHSGMFLSRIWARNNAFTLIELLVVVLIIGILAAVAVPQYQKAVEKSRAATVLSLLKAVGQAQETYKMANGVYATSFDELSVDVPWTGNMKWYTDENAEKDTRSNADWSIALKKVTNMAVTMGRISGPYAGAGFIYILEDGAVPTGTIICTEQKAGGIEYVGAKGSYCQKIMRAGEEVDGGATRYLWFL